MTYNDAIDLTMSMIKTELQAAMTMWPSMHSPHEGFAVILEEVDELWEQVKVNQNRHDIAKMSTEAIQIAAMAARFVIDITMKVQDGH